MAAWLVLLHAEARAQDKSSLGRDMASGNGVSVLVIVLAIFGLIWLAHHRARSRVNGRLKEIRSRATDLPPPGPRR